MLNVDKFPQRHELDAWHGFPALIQEATNHSPWREAGSARYLAPADGWKLAANKGVLRIPRPLSHIDSGENLLHRLGLLFEQMSPEVHAPWVLTDALFALGMNDGVDGHAENWFSALAVAVAVCWESRHPRVIAIERWPEMEVAEVSRVLACLRRVADEGHGIWLNPFGMMALATEPSPMPNGDRA